MPKKKHKTPPNMDHLFDRDLISEADYRDFWDGYWKARDKDQYIEDWIGEEEEEEPEREITPPPPIEKPKPHRGKTARKTAEREARKIGGYVVRRDARGRYSKRGHTFQAIRRRKK